MHLPLASRNRHSRTWRIYERGDSGAGYVAGHVGHSPGYRGIIPQTVAPLTDQQSFERLQLGIEHDFHICISVVNYGKKVLVSLFLSFDAALYKKCGVD